MNEIDLHGMRHEDVQNALERTINILWGTNEELTIITGHSPKMKKIVLDILVQYKLEYTIGDWSGQNKGFIKTFLD